MKKIVAIMSISFLYIATADAMLLTWAIFKRMEKETVKRDYKPLDRAHDDEKELADRSKLAVAALHAFIERQPTAMETIKSDNTVVEVISYCLECKSDSCCM